MDARGLRIDIASPCSVPWDAMRGDERVRFCGLCRQNVYNVQALTQDEAERLITQREGRMCVRILQRGDGTVVTRDCWSRLKAARRKGVVHLVFMMIAVGWAQLAAMTSGLSQLRSLWLAAWPRSTLATRLSPCPVPTREVRGELMGSVAPRHPGPPPVAPAPVVPPPAYDVAAHAYPILPGKLPRR